MQRESANTGVPFESVHAAAVNVQNASFGGWGAGGCMAHALVALGVFNTNDDAIAALDAMIPIVQKNEPSQRWVGRLGDSWSQAVVLAVLRKKGYNMHKLKHGKEFYACADDCFIIDGILAQHWHTEENGKLIAMTNDPTCKDGPKKDARAWRHCVAVKGEFALEQLNQRIPKQRLGVSKRLAINKHHTRNSKKTRKGQYYFHSVCKVYSIKHTRNS